mgnify:CR=1 FL=1
MRELVSRVRNRKRLLRMIKLGLITQAEASASSASDGEGEAEVIVDYELPAIEIQRAYRRHLQWHALINRFPRRKQLIEAELFSAHLHAMAQRAQRMYRAYKLRHFLRNRITARLFVNYRLIQPTLIRSAAAVLIQIPLRNVMCREKLNFIFAARKVLMEAHLEANIHILSGPIDGGQILEEHGLIPVLNSLRDINLWKDEHCLIEIGFGFQLS